PSHGPRWWSAHGHSPRPAPGAAADPSARRGFRSVRPGGPTHATVVRNRRPRTADRRNTVEPGKAPARHDRGPALRAAGPAEPKEFHVAETTQPTDEPPIDGRKLRWQQHKLQRRAELSDGA